VQMRDRDVAGASGTGLVPVNIQRASVVGQVTDHLREAILEGVIPSGARLRQEQVAAELGVSRTPVREAFRSLATEGLVDLNQNTADVIALSDKDAREYYELRELVDGMAARLAALRSTAAERARLEEIGQELLAETKPFHTGKWLTSHTAFHLGILRASGNQRFSQFEIVVRISSQMLYPRLSSDEKRMLASSREHLDILRAIDEGDADKAELLARQHIRAATTAWLNRESSSQSEEVIST
jgi:GntR family transcriptional regulator, vanillate catabolism transcriptional regulator